MQEAKATKMIGSDLSQKILEYVAERMSHTTATTEKMYRHRQQHGKAVSAFEKIQTLSSKLANIMNDNTLIICKFYCLGTHDEPRRKSFLSLTTDKLQAEFKEEIRKGVRPSLKQCRDFISQFRIKGKTAKQVNNTIM